MSMLDAALSIAARGFPVLPLARDKKIPITESGFHDASTDAAQVREWWTRNPHANIGLVVGEESNLFVLDVDNKGGKNGSAELEKLEIICGRLPPTYVVATASGGLHYYFKYPDELRGHDLRKELAEGLDLKYNGYVVAPPSVVNGAPYSVVNDAALADFPASMLEACIKEPVKVDPNEIARRERTAQAGASSIVDKYGLTLAHVGLTIPSNARRTGEGYLFEHPIHGATGGGNLYANLNKNLWCCYRCDSGGDPITWVAVREGLIDCAEARGGLDKEIVKRCVEILRDEGAIPDDRATVREPNGSAITIEVRGCEDISNVARFCSKYGDKLRYCTETGKWLEFDGKRWSEVSATAVKHRARDVITIIRYEAAEAGRLTGDESKAEKKRKELIADELTKWARTSSYKVRLEALIDMAKGDLAISALAFDRDPLLVNCDNGTYDIRTGELRAHDAEDYFTHVAGPYLRGAKNNAWVAFLERVQPSADMRGFLQRATGYSATGLTNQEALFFCYGLPATGKSTFLEAIRDALGSYGKTAPFHVFLARGGDNAKGEARPDLLRLRGTRLVTCSEVSEGTRWDSALINTLVSGERFVARALYANDSIEFDPEFKLWFGANHRPKTHYDPDVEDGIWRRLKIIPFEVIIPEGERDAGLKDYFKGNEGARAAIFAWTLEGATQWYKISEGGHADGLREPSGVKTARREYQAAQSPIFEFIMNECMVGYPITKKVDADGVHTIETGAIYEEALLDLYDVFSDARKAYNTKKVKSARSFAKYLKGFGFRRYRDTRDKSYHWEGLRLLRVGEEPDDIATQAWLNGSIDPLIFGSVYKVLSHEGGAENSPFIEPLSHDSDLVKGDERSEENDIPHIRDVILDVLNVLEKQHHGSMPLTARALMSAIITTACTIEPNLSRSLTVKTLQKLMTDAKFMSRLDRLTAGRMSNYIALGEGS